MRPESRSSRALGSEVCRACAASPWCRCSTWAGSRWPTSCPRRRRRASAAAPSRCTCGSARPAASARSGEYVLPERLFGDYPYLSSVSASWLAHAKEYAAAKDAELGLAADGAVVVEVASNDGYLLRHFLDLGVRVLGVEPAANVADIARARGRRHGHRVLRAGGGGAGGRLARAPAAGGGQQRHGARSRPRRLRRRASRCSADDRTVITVENPSFLTLLDADAVRHDLPRALLVPLRARGVPAGRAARARAGRRRGPAHARRLLPLHDRAPG